MENNPGVSLFQSSGINIENPLQNQEEDEDLEEQKRRQEEIQNFLTTAMDEFNYDDQSTVNSSTNVSMDDMYNTQSVMEKYKNANLDDQLKVLYEVRVREVRMLAEQLEQLKVEIDKQKEVNGKTAMLLEAEKDKVRISSKQSQDLLTNKVEEISNLKREIDALRSTVLSLETTVKAVNDEYSLCKQSNKELIDQLSLMHNGLTTNTISDRQLQEHHHAEVSQLHNLLDSAHTKLHRKEKEYKELEQKLKETRNDKDTVMMEKCSTVNQLTQNLENALGRCQEFSQIIEKLAQENRTLKLSTTTTELSDSIKAMGLMDKTEIVKALQKELERTHEMQKQQNGELESLRNTCNKLSKECKKNEISNEEYKKELELWQRKCATSNDDLNKLNNESKELKLQLEDHRKNAATECRIYENKIKQLQESLQSHENIQSQDNAVQVSTIFTDNLNAEKEENQKLKNQIVTLTNEIQMLNQRLMDAENRESQMKLAVTLDKEREALIKSLQKKAAKFEEIIKRKQSKPETSTVAVNTDSFLTVDHSEKEHLLQTKFDTDLLQKEIEIRKEVKMDFDLKLEKMMQKEASRKLHHSQERNCESCADLQANLEHVKLSTDVKEEEIAGLKEQMRQDREAVATLLEEWGGKFMQLEVEKKELYVECENLKDTCDQLLLKLKTRETGDSKLYEVIKKECEETIKMWNKNTLENLHRFLSSQQAKIQRSDKKIDELSKNVDMEVHAIEMQYLRKKQSLEKEMVYNKQMKYHT